MYSSVFYLWQFVFFLVSICVIQTGQVSPHHFLPFTIFCSFVHVTNAFFERENLFNIVLFIMLILSFVHSFFSFFISCLFVSGQVFRQQWFDRRPHLYVDTNNNSWSNVHKKFHWMLQNDIMNYFISWILWMEQNGWDWIFIDRKLN